MTDDFALIDFAFLLRSPAEIAGAIAELGSRDAISEPSGGQPDQSETGILNRLFGSNGAATGARRGNASLLIQPQGFLDGRIVRHDLLESSGTDLDSPVRITSPIGTADLTLLEFRGSDGDNSDLCEGVSEALSGVEVFRFRHSGNRHPGACYMFQVYCDGRLIRNVSSSSPSGTAPEANWDGMDSGMPHPVETDSLSAPAVPKSKIMTPDRLGNILNGLGCDPLSLFDLPRHGVTVLELAKDPEGVPLRDVDSVLEARAPRRTEPEDNLKSDSEEKLIEKGDVKIMDTDLGKAAPWETQIPAPSWEEEVTKLLLSAVQAALPADQQVAWLTELTAQLEAGDVDRALDDAQAMIETGNRPTDEKEAAVDRLSELFGRGVQGGASH